MMDSRISAAVSAGSISSTDQDALETALDSIDSSLSADRSSGTKPSGDMKSKIDSLIDKQVQDGTLTDDQATELKSFFAQGPGGSGGPHGAGGPGGPGGPPPSSASATSDDDDDDTTTNTADATTKQLDTLITFLEKLRESVSSGVYSDGSSSSGSSSSNSSNSGLLIDTTA
jgi:hypothetical protein